MSVNIYLKEWANYEVINANDLNNNFKLLQAAYSGNLLLPLPLPWDYNTPLKLSNLASNNYFAQNIDLRKVFNIPASIPALTAIFAQQTYTDPAKPNVVYFATSAEVSFLDVSGNLNVDTWIAQGKSTDTSLTWVLTSESVAGNRLDPKLTSSQTSLGTPFIHNNTSPTGEKSSINFGDDGNTQITGNQTVQILTSSATGEEQTAIFGNIGISLYKQVDLNDQILFGVSKIVSGSAPQAVSPSIILADNSINLYAVGAGAKEATITMTAGSDQNKVQVATFTDTAINFLKYLDMNQQQIKDLADGILDKDAMTVGQFNNKLFNDLEAGQNITITQNPSNKKVVISSTGGGTSTWLSTRLSSEDTPSSALAMIRYNDNLQMRWDLQGTDTLMALKADGIVLENKTKPMFSINNTGAILSVPLDVNNNKISKVGKATLPTDAMILGQFFDALDTALLPGNNVTFEKNLTDQTIKINSTGGGGTGTWASLSTKSYDDTTDGITHVLRGTLNDYGGGFVDIQILNNANQNNLVFNLGLIGIAGEDAVVFNIAKDQTEKNQLSLSIDSIDMTVPLNMNNQKITGLANATVATDAMAFGQFYPTMKDKLKPGTNMALTYDDTAGTITFSATGGKAGTWASDNLASVDNGEGSGIIKYNTASFILGIQMDFDKTTSDTKMLLKSQNFSFGTPLKEYMNADGININALIPLNVVTPTMPTNAVPKSYVDAVAIGFQFVIPPGKYLKIAGAVQNFVINIQVWDGASTNQIVQTVVKTDLISTYKNIITSVNNVDPSVFACSVDYRATDPKDFYIGNKRTTLDVVVYIVSATQIDHSNWIIQDNEPLGTTILPLDWVKFPSNTWQAAQLYSGEVGDRSRIGYGSLDTALDYIDFGQQIVELNSQVIWFGLAGVEYASIDVNGMDINGPLIMHGERVQDIGNAVNDNEATAWGQVKNNLLATPLTSTSNTQLATFGVRDPDQPTFWKSKIDFALGNDNGMGFTSGGAFIFQVLGGLNPPRYNFAINPTTISAQCDFHMGDDNIRYKIRDLLDPEGPYDAANKKYVDEHTGTGAVSSVLPKPGHTAVVVEPSTGIGNVLLSLSNPLPNPAIFTIKEVTERPEIAINAYWNTAQGNTPTWSLRVNNQNGGWAMVHDNLNDKVSLSFSNSSGDPFYNKINCNQFVVTEVADGTGDLDAVNVRTFTRKIESLKLLASNLLSQNSAQYGGMVGALDTTTGHLAQTGYNDNKLGDLLLQFTDSWTVKIGGMTGRPTEQVMQLAYKNNDPAQGWLWTLATNVQMFSNLYHITLARDAQTDMEVPTYRQLKGIVGPTKVNIVNTTTGTIAADTGSSTPSKLIFILIGDPQDYLSVKPDMTTNEQWMFKVRNKTAQSKWNSFTAKATGTGPVQQADGPPTTTMWGIVKPYKRVFSYFSVITAAGDSYTALVIETESGNFDNIDQGANLEIYDVYKLGM